MHNARLLSKHQIAIELNFPDNFKQTLPKIKFHAVEFGIKLKYEFVKEETKVSVCFVVVVLFYVPLSDTGCVQMRMKGSGYASHSPCYTT